MQFEESWPKRAPTPNLGEPFGQTAHGSRYLKRRAQMPSAGGNSSRPMRRVCARRCSPSAGRRPLGRVAAGSVAWTQPGPTRAPPIELRRCSDRCCPLQSGRSWPGCGPSGHELGRRVPALSNRAARTSTSESGRGSGRKARSLFSVPQPQCRAAGPQSMNRGTIVDDAYSACRSVPSGRIRYMVGTRPGPSSRKTIH
jgi:hypothetical protein